MIMFNTLTMGYKGYFIKSFADGFYVASINKYMEWQAAHFISLISSFCQLELKKKFGKFLFINTGVNINYLLDEPRTFGFSLT